MPQLVMIRPQLRILPGIELPEGYSLRHFRPGDEDAWAAVITDAFDETYTFSPFMDADPQYKPERVLFICHGDTPVATAAAWRYKNLPDTYGHVHMVGVLGRYRGLGLGLAINTAVLHRLAQEGAERSSLLTDDFRLAAIKTYLKLGFCPAIVAVQPHYSRSDTLAEVNRSRRTQPSRGVNRPCRSQPDRWRDVFSKLNYPVDESTWIDARQLLPDQPME